MSDGPSVYRRLRTPLFAVAIALYLLAFLALPTRQVSLELVTVWVSEPDIHALHDVNGAALLWVFLLGVVVQAYRPERRLPALAGTIVGWVVLLVILVADGSPLVMLPGIFLALAVLVGAYHPAGRSGWRVTPTRGFAVVPLAMTAVAAVPAAVYAVNQVSLQLTVVDSHAAEGHYALMAVMGIVLVVSGVLASGARAGWRVPAWSAGGLAVVLGLSSVAFPLFASSVGPTWGVLAIGWGVAFVVVCEGMATEAAPTVLRRRLAGPT